jgi:uncharacterized protein
MNTFVGREHELELLDQLWERPVSQFLVLYGRRRIGKTTLLTHWMETRRQSVGSRVLYWVAAPNSTTVQLRSFSQAVYRFANPTAPLRHDFTFTSWEQAWYELFQAARDERLAVFIDEFTYLLEVDPGLAGQLQNYWDSMLGKSNLFLCLSGSHLGMMKRQFLSYQAPLYGRATAQIHLQPLPFGTTRRFFPNYTAADRVAIYNMFGGVPAYWTRLDPQKSVAWNIKTQLLTPNNLMQAEPRLLLADFISEAHNYISILGAIANGARTPKEIAAVTGQSNVEVPKYLSVLAESGFVERRISVTAAPSSRQGRHHISDPYLRFYYRFLANRQDQLALGIKNQALAEITRHLIDFIGVHTWEELCREWVLRAGAQGELPMPDRVGAAWNPTVQVDVAGINRMHKTMILGECKWTLEAQERKVLVELVTQKAEKIVPSDGRWRVYFLGFSRSGWTRGAYAYIDELSQNPVEGKNWITAGLRLLDLNEVDEDLVSWN